MAMEKLRFDGRVVVVTGAGGGIGRAHAHLLADRGARVVVNDIGVGMAGGGRSHSPADQVVTEITDSGGIAVASMDDVATEHGAYRLIATAVDTFGRVDAVIHNAGICTFIPFAEMTYEQYRQVVSVHQDGAFLLAKAAWPHMVAQRQGRLVFISSLANMGRIAHYAAAKSSLVGFVRSLAAEGSEHGISSNALSVLAYTRMMSGYFHRDSGHADIGLFGQAAMEEWWRDNLRPEQVSSVAAWLAHDACDISGETLLTGGGHVARQFVGISAGFAHRELTPEQVAGHRDEILAVTADFNIHGAAEQGNWQLKRIVDGGAPRLP
jgi:NAD(P)-dependent dehydrogenase (short-subunit alcohol dehydrogenase family)